MPWRQWVRRGSGKNTAVHSTKLELTPFPKVGKGSFVVSSSISLPLGRTAPVWSPLVSSTGNAAAPGSHLGPSENPSLFSLRKNLSSKWLLFACGVVLRGYTF